MMQPMRLLMAAVVALAVGCDRAVVTLCESGEPGLTSVAVSVPGRWFSPPRMIELWRAGGAREAEVLALPAAVVVSASDHAAVPDFQLATVAVIGPDGSWLGNWAQPGRGPGEVQAPIAAAWDSEGVLSVWDIVGSKVIRVRAGAVHDGEIAVDPVFSNAVVASGQVLWAAVQSSGTVATKRRDHLGDSNIDLQRREETLLRLPPGAQEPDIVARAEVRVLSAPFDNYLVPGETGIVAALSSSGRFAIVDEGGTYQVRVHLAEGGLLLCRSSSPQPLTAEERGEVVEPAWGALPGALRAAQREGGPQAVGRMFFDAEERLWVQRDRPSPFDAWGVLYGPPGGRYDVFSPAGDYLGEVHAPADARLQGALGDTIWALEMGALDEPWIVAYQMVSE